MATFGNYIDEKISLRRLPIGEVTRAEIFLKTGLNPDDNMTLEGNLLIEIQLLYVIAELLLTPDKKQGDSSITYDREAIVNYYNLRTAELGLPNVLEQENSINDASFIW